MGHNGRLLAQLHGTFTPAWFSHGHARCLRRFERGLSPPRGSHTAMLVACDALNARTTTTREYHCPACTSSPASCHTCFMALCFSLRFSHREKPHGAPAARLGTDRMCPFCPMMRRRYLAGIFVKVLSGASGGMTDRGKGKAFRIAGGPVVKSLV